MKALVFIFLLLHHLVAVAMTIETAVDRNPVSLNESFEVTFTASDTPSGDPDFSPLNADFDVLNQSHSSQSSWINGKISQTIQWSVQLMAKHAGSLNIPAISFGQDTSNPLSITVTQQDSADINTDQDLFLKVEATPLNPYIQSQVTYTLKLFRRVNLTQAALGEPTLADAVVQKLGDDSNYSTQVKGVDYAVTERKYAIFPQKSGSVTIPPLQLTAEVLSAGQPRFNGFFNQQITRSKQIASEAIKLEVRPAPTNPAMAHWLPAEDLQIKQEWSGDITQMKVGEPLTRTLIIMAKGATVGSLPELNSSKTSPQYKSYPDQPNLKELPRSEGIYAMREEKIAIIPSSSGSIVLPAIEIPWFNVRTQQVEIAKIAATTLNVTGGAPAPASTPTPAPLPKPKTADTPQAANPSPSTMAVAENQWFWLTIFFASAWLITLIYLWVSRRPKRVQPSVSPVSHKQPDFQQQLKLACQENNLHSAKQTLLAWGSAYFGVNSLGALAELCDARLRDEILLINELLYAPQAEANNWQGKKLLQAFNEHNITQKFQRSAPEALEPLFKL